MTAARRLLPVLVALGALVQASCSSDDEGTHREVPYPHASCTSYVLAQQTDDGTPGGALAVLGSWDDWAKPTPMQPHPTRAGWWYAPLDLPAGEYGYLIQQGAISRLDASNLQTTFRNTIEVSRLTVTDCRVSSLTVDSAQGDNQGAVTIAGRFVASSDGAALASVTATSPGGALTVASLDPATGAFRLTGTNFPRGRHAVTVTAVDDRGGAATARASAWVAPLTRSWDEGLLYQVVVDRFRGADGAALEAPPTPGSRAGGSLDGVRAELEKGTFDALGVTAIWLSPPYLNPSEARAGVDGHMYEGYHGYWPLASREVDPRIGGEDALHAVIDTAHAHGIRVLLDVVPNHVYEANPLRAAHLGDGWFNDTNACVCGTSGCDWSTHIQSCWFTPYLPDIRWQNQEAAQHQVDDVQWWVDTFNVDGVRVDAVPMMQRAATRRLSRQLHLSGAADEQPFVIGEVFTGPGLGGIDQIRYFLGPESLDSAFDFPLMWALRSSVATDQAGLDTIESTLAATDTSLDGSGAVKARIIGNHDVSRFLSVAAGDDGNAPWDNPPPRPTDPRVFARHRMALSLLLTLPGMPVLYYGDEVALPGASDPDCRRVLPSLDALPDEEATTLALTRTLGSLRACSPSLRRGDRHVLVATPTLYAFERTLDGDRVIVAVAKGNGPVDLPLPEGSYRDVLTPGQPIVTGSIAVAPLTSRVLIGAASECH